MHVRDTKSRCRQDRIECRARTGFSLLELVMVTTLIGIVTAIVLPRIEISGHDAKCKTCRQYVADVNKGVEKYRLYVGALPTQVSDLESDEYYGPEIPLWPVDETVYQLSSQTGRVIGHRH